jgi:Na+-transporting NADH:ubiquinone oxidoreductase subunit B/electron transport complex protein RnfD
MVEGTQSFPTESISRDRMLLVAGALLVLLLRAAQVFGLSTLAMATVATVSVLLVEIVFSRVRKYEMGFSWLVTALVFTLILPPATPLWMVAVGAVFGAFFGKAVFGGHGKNVFNAAVVGRLFLTFSFPQYMITRWLNPLTGVIVSGATPLNSLNRGLPDPFTRMELLMGRVPGTLGETFRLGILVLGLILVILKVVDWRIPVSFVGTVFLFNLVGGLLAPDRFRDPVTSLLVGGLLFGAFFVATDPVTSPYRNQSKYLFGLGLGLITVLIRNFGGHNEGIMFAVIIMNALSPQLDNLTARWRQEGVKA